MQLFEPQIGYVERMETVHVLLAADRRDHPILVDMLRQGQLHQNPVHAVVGVQFADQRQQLRLARLRRAADRRVANPHLGRRLGLARHIRHAAGVFTHQNHDQMGHPAVFFAERRHLGGHFGLKFR